MRKGWKHKKTPIIVGNEQEPAKMESGQVIINKKATKKNLDRLIDINNDGLDSEKSKVTTDGTDGGLLKGKPHYDKNGNPLGGIPVIVDGSKNIEVEGEEFVVNKEASQKHWKELSKINQSEGNGVPINPSDVGADDDPEEYKDGGRIIDFNPNHLPNRRIYDYAKMVKTKYPKVWDLGGNIFGNEAFNNLERVLKRGYWTDNEEWMYVKWRSYVARHKQDFRIAGVIAMLKWVDKVDRGWEYMRNLIDKEIEKRYSKKKQGGVTEPENSVIDKILNEVEPLKVELTEKWIEAYRKENEKNPTKYDIEMYQFSLTMDLVKAIGNYIEKSDSVKDIIIERQQGSIVIDCTILRDSKEHKFSTEVIIAGGYNIQRLHLRYIVKTDLPNKRVNPYYEKLNEQYKKMTKAERLREQISFAKKAIAKYEVKLNEAKENSKLSDLEVEKLSREDRPDSWRTNDTSWETIVERGADKNFDYSKEKYLQSQKEYKDFLIKSWINSNANYRQYENNIKREQKEIDKLNKKLSDLGFEKMASGGAVTYKEKYNKKYGYKKNESHDLEEISEDTGISEKGLQQIYNKGIGAYKTNPESVRPNVKSKEQWAMGRVYSAVMGGKAARIDANELKMENGGSFTSYADAMEWIERKSDEYGGKNKFFSSNEYKKIYPKIKSLYDIEKSSYNKIALKAMQEANVNFGDKVFYDNVNPFGIVEEYTGEIINKNGIPYVKLSEGQQTISGSKSVKWHKGWKKIGKMAESGDMSKHLSPNGKPSNLNHEQWHLVRTPEFKAWFGDWEEAYKTGNYDNVSKVIDEETKEPLVVYHGTGEYINIFDKNKAQDIEGRKFGVGTGKGVFSFTDDYNNALSWAERSKERKDYGVKSYNPNVLSVFLNFKNPISRDDFQSRLDIEFEGYMFRPQKERDKKISKIYRDYKKEKIDGLISDFGEYTAFEPNQIKLADGTNTTFDSNNPDIRYDKGGNIVNNACVEELVNLIDSHSEIKYWVVDKNTNNLVIVFKEEIGVYDVEIYNNFLKKLTECSNVFDKEVEIQYDNKEYKTIFIKLKTSNIDYIEMENGGSTSWDKLASASSRFRPYETIVFDPPLIGLNGAKLTAYTWAYEMTMLPNREGELVGKRVSDWSQAEISAETGRGIVHQYTIELPNGEVRTVSSESVPILLGYQDRTQAKVFGNLATASKTLAKQQMKLAIMEAQKKEYDDLVAKFEKEPKPSVVKAEFDDLPFITKKVFERESEFGKVPSFTYFKMGDVIYSQDNQYSYDEKGYILAQNPDKRTIEQLTGLWISKRVEEAGGKYPRGLYELKNRVERQKRKVENMLNPKMADGGSIEDEMAKFDWESLYNPSPEEEKRRDEELQKSKEQEKEDWYQGTKFSKKWAATYQDAVNRTVKDYFDAKATYDDWASRQYKSNKGMVYLGGDDIFGEAKSIGSINEGRRQRVLRGAKMQMDESIETLKELQLSQEEIDNLLQNKMAKGGITESHEDLENRIYKEQFGK